MYRSISVNCFVQYCKRRFVPSDKAECEAYPTVSDRKAKKRRDSCCTLIKIIYRVADGADINNKIALKPHIGSFKLSWRNKTHYN